jgi:hypothetical protein
MGYRDGILLLADLRESHRTAAGVSLDGDCSPRRPKR